MERSRTYVATPPGATIKEQLLNRGMNQKEFAARMGMSEKHISKLINGEVQLTIDMARRKTNDDRENKTIFAICLRGTPQDAYRQ